MKEVRDFLSESGTIMILADPTGTILETAGDPATVDSAWNIRLVTGANWNEGACGTNAIGTALSIGDSVQVHAAEHFCSGIKPWTCSASVIRDPVDGEIIGVLDVSGQKDSFTRHCLSLAVIAAGRIEGELARREEEQRHHLLAAGLRRTSTGGLMFFGSPLVGTVGWLLFLFSLLVSHKQRRRFRWRAPTPYRVAPVPGSFATPSTSRFRWSR